jgi:carbohydrate-binding DOMON domain-containing protein
VKLAAILLALLLSVLLSVLIVQWEQLATLKEMASALNIPNPYLPAENDMSRTQTWRYLDSNGEVQIHTTTTVYRDAAHPTETKAEWKARFEAEVAADEIIYPPIA